MYKNKIKYISDKKIIKKINIKKKSLNKLKQNYLQNKFILKILKKKIPDVSGLSIDTRILKKNNIFLTLKGKSNGNLFVKEALRKGASYIVTSSNLKTNNKKIIKTNNTISFLKDFAKLKREKSLARITITGSAGKTSLKNLIKELLDTYGGTYSSQNLSIII